MSNMKINSSIYSKNPRKKIINNGIKLILCDLGNVLVNFDHRLAVRRILEFSVLPFDQIYQIFFDSHLTKDFEEGRVSSLEFFKRLKKELKLQGLTYKKFMPMWNEIFSANPKMVKLLSKLKKQYRLHLVSNINELHYDYILKEFRDHLDVFDEVYLSCRVGHRKPHPAIYKAAIKSAKVSPSEVIYTDDRADLIEKAQKMGFKTILFKNTEDFKKELKKIGIFS